MSLTNPASVVVAKYYYDYHYAKFKTKKVLSSKVSYYVDAKIPNGLKTLEEAELTTFALTFEQSADKIRVDPSASEEIVGPDTHFRLMKNNPVAAKPRNDRSRKTIQRYQPESTQGSSPRRKRSRTTQNHPNESDLSPPKESAKPSSKRSRSNHREHSEESEQSETADHGETQVKAETDAVKVEASGTLGEQDGFGCIDLCESSDEEGTDGHQGSSNGNGHADGEAECAPREDGEDGAPQNEPQQAAEDGASLPDHSEIHKIQELEQAMHKLKEETLALGRENKALKAELQQKNEELEKKDKELEKKDNVISALKRRLGA